MSMVVRLLYRSIDADQVSPSGITLVAVAVLVARTLTVAG